MVIIHYFYQMYFKNISEIKTEEKQPIHEF